MKGTTKGAPISFAYKGCVFQNFYLTGDAAGLASKLTGEGISSALISGQEIGKKIINLCYKMNKLNMFLKFKKRQEKIEKIANIFPFAQKYFLKVFMILIEKKWIQKYFGI